MDSSEQSGESVLLLNLPLLMRSCVSATFLSLCVNPHSGEADYQRVCADVFPHLSAAVQVGQVHMGGCLHVHRVRGLTSIHSVLMDYS